MHIPHDLPAEIMSRIWDQFGSHAPDLWWLVVEQNVEKWREEVRKRVFKERTFFPPEK